MKTVLFLAFIIFQQILPSSSAMTIEDIIKDDNTPNADRFESTVSRKFPDHKQKSDLYRKVNLRKVVKHMLQKVNEFQAKILKTNNRFSLNMKIYYYN